MSRITYTEAEADFLREFIPGHTAEEVAAEFSRRFRPLTAANVRSWRHNHKTWSGLKGKRKDGTSGVWPQAALDALRELSPGRTSAETAALLNARLGTSYTPAQVASKRKNLRLTGAKDPRFRKGHEPPNKGRKGLRIPGCEKGWFRKGQRPHNATPVGTEVMATIGYLKVKVAEPNVWEWKHIMEWERANGPVPAGMCVVFLDGDTRNCDPSNLTLMDRAELSCMNHSGLGKVEGARPAVIALAKLRHALAGKRRKAEGK